MPAGVERADIRLAHVPGMQFAIDMCLAHAAGDKLGVLGTEIEDEDFLVHVDRRDGETRRGEERFRLLPFSIRSPRSLRS